MIRFNRLNIKNFIRFKDLSVNFSDDSSKPITLVYGINGAGKTTIMRAVRWALVGDTGDKGFNSFKNLLNREAEDNGDYNFSADVYFDYEEDKYHISRSASLKDGVESPTKDTDFNIRTNFSKNGVQISSNKVDETIESIFPKNLLNFYFFDGEDLRDYEEGLDNEGDFIKEKVEKVTKIPDLIRVEGFLKLITRRLRQETKRGEDNVIDELNEQIEKKEGEKEKQEDIRDTSKEDMQGYEGKLDELKKTILDSDEAFVEHYNRVQDEIDEINEKYISEKINLQNIMPDVWINLIEKKLENYRKNSKGILDYIPHRDIKPFLEYIKSQPKCDVCGQKHSDVSENFIEKLMDTSADNDDFKFNIIFKEILSRKNKSNYADSYEKVKNLETELALKKNEKTNFSKVDVKDYRKNKDLIADRDRIAKQLSREEEKNKDAISKIKDIDRDLDFLFSSRTKLLNQKGDQDLHLKHSKLAETTSLFLQKFKEHLILKTKKQVEKKANEIFQKIEKEYYSLKISEDYQMKMYRVSDDVELEPSAAQKLFIALALITALKETVSIRGPMIIDSLFLRISIENAVSLINQIDDISPQIALLASDNEIDNKIINQALMEKTTYKHVVDRVNASVSTIIEEA